MSWACPDCGAGAVHSRVEVRRVYNWRAILKGREYDVADALQGYRRAPDPSEGASAFVRRWLDGDGDQPDYLCLSCCTPHSSQEVPA